MNDHFQHPLSEVYGINFSQRTMWPWQLDSCMILSQLSQSIFFFCFFIFGYSCFTVLLVSVDNEVNQLHVYINPFLLDLPPPPHPIHRGHRGAPS